VIQPSARAFLLREVYAEPFAAAIRDAGLASMMNSYSSIDGLPCAGSASILTELLRRPQSPGCRWAAGLRRPVPSSVHR